MSPEVSPWWRETVGYQVYLRSFADSDGDGIGDLAGLRSHLGHLTELGVDALWVSPFYPSPQVDHGYDVADHRAVDPIFGELSDVDDLVSDAHVAGIKVLLDVVPNHTSDRHPWFQAAIADGATDADRARYHLLAGRGADGELPPNGWSSMFGGPVWTRLADGYWYLHLFAPEQPDLNWTNAEVATDFDTTLRFWLDRGVDGVRIDVAGGMCKEPRYAEIVKGAPHPHWNRPEVGALHQRWRRVVDSYPGDRVTVGEMWGSPQRVAKRVAPGGLHQVFQFDWVVAEWSASALRGVASAALRELGEVGALPTWLLSSHDLPRPVSRYGDGSLGVDRARGKALVTLALPGAAWIYQGEELGLPDIALPDAVLQDPTWERSGHTDRGRDGVRVPLPWSADADDGYGFSTGTPWLPQPAQWAELSVQSQADAPSSTFALYRKALRLRRKLLVGESFDWVDAAPDVLAFRRGPVVCALNTGEKPRTVPVSGEPLLASVPLTGEGLLPPNAAVWMLAD